VEKTGEKQVFKKNVVHAGDEKGRRTSSALSMQRFSPKSEQITIAGGVPRQKKNESKRRVWHGQSLQQKLTVEKTI